MKAEEKERAYLIDAYNQTFSTPAGEKVLTDLMERGKLLQPLENPTDEGKRELVLHILHQLAYDVTAILNMVKDDNKSRKGEFNEEEDTDFDFFRD